MAIETSPSADELRGELDKHGVEFVFAQFVDMHGKPNAKLVPVAHLDGLLSDGAGFAGFAAGDIGQGPHDPDIAAMPDPSTLTFLPWKPEVARFACDVTVEGEPWPYCPRTILRNQLERASGIAEMSGSCGPWPMSPAANPANPAPSAKSPSRCATGTSFAFGLPCMSTNWAKTNCTPWSVSWVRSSAAEGVVSIAMAQSYQRGGGAPAMAAVTASGSRMVCDVHIGSRDETVTLRAVISTVFSTLEIDAVLAGVVDLVTEATRCHACLIYLVEGDRLVLRAASPVHAEFVGRISMSFDEGVTGWVASTGQPALIRDEALHDPRMKYFPELEEERWQSMAAVPIPARSGEVIGVIVLHTTAPRSS